MSTSMTQRTFSAMACALAFTLTTPVSLAAEAGLQMLNLTTKNASSESGAVVSDQSTSVALFYPTRTVERDLPMGPFTVSAAMYGPPESKMRGLIVLSHGVGGSELGHASLAQTLARAGYLVAAMRHPGDNWQDGRLIQSGPVQYFTQRPMQVSRVIDALLADPKWMDRIARDERGPRIGVLGHSAGGYTVMALAGGAPDLSRLRQHCTQEASKDPIFCSMGQRDNKSGTQANATASISESSLKALRDPRVRAVAAMAPVGVLLSPSSLADIKVPVRIFVPGMDRFLVPAFHGDYLLKANPAFEARHTPEAWHFAFMDKPSMPIPSPDGDIAADPAGFNRGTHLSEVGQDLLQFFDQALR